MPEGKASVMSWVAALAWLAVMLDGFDLVMLGVVAPKMLSDNLWGVTPGDIAAISTAGLVGMMVGGMIVGSFTHLLGRRRTLAISVAWMSVFTLLSAAAPSALAFGSLRFLAGLGLGGCVPTAIALVSEYSRSGKSSSATTTTMTGYQVGAMLTALVGIVVIPALGWRAMFVIGAIPGLALVPLILRYLPDSRPSTQPLPPRSRDIVLALFRGGRAVTTTAFWVASFMGLLLVYGLNTWLPQIMRIAGYPLGAALGLLLTLNLGGMIGMIVAGRVADRVGVRGPTIAWFVAAAVLLALLSVKLPGAALYVVVFVTGFFVFSAQVLVFAYVAVSYGDALRASGLGWVAGVGRLGAITGPIIGGLLLNVGLAYPWGFYTYAVVAALGAVAVVAVRAVRTVHTPTAGKASMPLA